MLAFDDRVDMTSRAAEANHEDLILYPDETLLGKQRVIKTGVVWQCML